jgi:hypothetical protein
MAEETDLKSGGGAAPPPSPPTNGRKPAGWGGPLNRLDQVWTKFETWFCVSVLVLEVLSLTLWVGLKGMSTRVESETPAGLIFRAVVGAVFLGGIALLLTRKRSKLVERVAVTSSIAVGILLSNAWVGWGVDFSANVLNWFQSASSLRLVGGLRGVGTRLTLLLALIGGSLATGAGKHITIDLITRALRPSFRLPVILIGWVGAAIICLVAAWGFFDHISIDRPFHSDPDATPAEKLSKVGEEIGEQSFILRKQISLDFKAIPHVMAGEPFSDWMTGTEWNQWVRDGGFAERYGEDQAKSIEIGPDEHRSPYVLIPGRGEPGPELVAVANLVFPIGLVIIALRFLLLCLLAISGHKDINPDSNEESFGDPPDPEKPGQSPTLAKMAGELGLGGIDDIEGNIGPLEQRGLAEDPSGPPESRPEPTGTPATVPSAVRGGAS